MLDHDEMRPRVDYNTHPSYDSFLVVWYEIDSSGMSTWVYVRGRLVTGVEGAGVSGSNTLVTDSEIAVDQVNYHLVPDVAYNLNHNEFLVVYVKDPSLAGGTGAEDIYGRRMTADGVLLAENAIDSSGEKQDYPAVAAYRLNMTNPYVVVFEDYWNDSAGDVRGYYLGVDGTPTTLITFADTSGEIEKMPHIASSEALGGYTAVWTEFDTTENAWNAFGRRLDSASGLNGLPFDLSEVGAPDGCSGEDPVVAGGAPVALSAWETNCFTPTMDIGGRLIGYRVSLPLIMR
jgi:hypothetical protein